MGKNENKLGFLGEDYQYKLVKEFISDKEFFKDLCDIIDQNLFSDKSLRSVVAAMREYYKKQQTVPDFSLLKIIMTEKSHSETEKEYNIAVIDKIHDTSSEGAGYVREVAEKFFKQQNMIRVANEIINIAGKGDVNNYDKCVDILNKALTQGLSEDLGCGVFDNENETLSDDYRIAIPTGIGKIDETLEGGLGKGELGCIIGSSSFGKVQPYDAKVVTVDGIKTMGEIKPGDYVIGRDGKGHKVLEVFPHKDWDFYKVTFSDGVSTECGKEHLWNVNSWYQRNAKKYVAGKSKNRDDKYYVHDYSYKTMSLEEIMNKGLYTWNGEHRFKVQMCEPVEFNEVSVEIDPYLFGYFIGDGYINSGVITVGENDISEVTNILEKVDSNFSVKKNVRDHITYSIVYGKQFGNLIKSFYKDDDCFTSECKYIPNEYLYNSKENRIKLLQGLMDSDGTCMKNGCSCFNSKSKMLAENVKMLVLSLGGYAKLREKKTGYFSKKLNEKVDCGIQYEVTISLRHDDIPIFRLKRKQERVHYRTKWKDNRYIHSVEYSRKADGQCIYIDGDEHLYLTDDFIVTHNTSLTTAMASYGATYRCPQNNNEGFKVVQIVFEDRIKQIQRKHMGRITGIEAKDLSKPDIVDQVKEQLLHYEDRELLQKNLRIIRLPSGEKTADDIKRLIVKLTNSGFRPDMVIVDYFECLLCKGDASDDKWEKEGKTMRKFESMAMELNIAIWIPVQGTKDSLNAEIVTMDKAGGSFKKIQIAHIVMSIARTVEDIEANIATIAILKNRAGKAGKVFNNVEFNNGTCRISTDNVDEFNGMADFKKQMEADRKKDIAEVFNMVKNNSSSR